MRTFCHIVQKFLVEGIDIIVAKCKLAHVLGFEPKHDYIPFTLSFHGKSVQGVTVLTISSIKLLNCDVCCIVMCASSSGHYFTERTKETIEKVV